jgi:hypothetical protein
MLKRNQTRQIRANNKRFGMHRPVNSLPQAGIFTPTGGRMDPHIALALAPWAPPDSEVHRIALEQASRESWKTVQREIDRAHAEELKWSNPYAQE